MTSLRFLFAYGMCIIGSTQWVGVGSLEISQKLVRHMTFLFVEVDERSTCCTYCGANKRPKIRPIALLSKSRLSRGALMERSELSFVETQSFIILPPSHFSAPIYLHFIGIKKLLWPNFLKIGFLESLGSHLSDGIISRWIPSFIADLLLILCANWPHFHHFKV